MTKIILLDFDGVIHSYTSGWKGATKIPDPPVDRAILWLEEFIMLYCDPPESIAAMAPRGEFKLCIYSSRSRRWGGRRAMRKWLVKHGLDKRFLEVISFPIMKPAAFLTIDDRCICFTGWFPTVEQLRDFRPWYQRPDPGILRMAPRHGVTEPSRR